MTVKRNRRSDKAFTLAELMVVVMLLGIITAVALPAYISSVNTTRQSAANENARALSAAVQAKATIVGSYDASVSNYIQDMGGIIPVNPCSGTAGGYTITVSGKTATISSVTGTYCGSWTPAPYTVSLGS